jgi:hypothetical protein
MNAPAWHTLGISEIFQQLGTCPKGLTDTACSRRQGFRGIIVYLPGLEFFLLSSRIHARSTVTNATRWAVDHNHKNIRLFCE